MSELWNCFFLHQTSPIKTGPPKLLILPNKMRPEKGFWPFLGFSCPSSSRQAGSPSEPHLYFWLSMASLQAPIIRFNMASCKIEKWKWKASKHQLSVSTWPVAKLKSESEKPPSTNHPFQFGKLQRKVKVKSLNTLIIHFIMASCKFEKWKWRFISTNYPF